MRTIQVVLETEKKNRKTIVLLIIGVLTIVIAAFVFLAALSITVGNFANSRKPEKKVHATYNPERNLNARQLEILRHEGVSSQELSSGTFDASPAITGESMLCYLEEKYPDELFAFKDFIPAEYMGFTQVSHSKVIATCRYGDVTVDFADGREAEKDADIYVDDMLTVKASYFYKNEVNEYLTKKYSPEKFLTHVDVWELDEGISTEDDFGKLDIIGSSYANLEIFVSEELGEGEYRELALDVSRFVRDRAGEKTVEAKIVRVKKESFSPDLPEDYEHRPMRAEGSILEIWVYTHTAGSDELEQEPNDA